MIKKERKLLTRRRRFGRLRSDMTKAAKKKPAVCILISRETKPESDLAAAIDEVASRFNQPVKSIGMIAIKLGLPAVENGFKQMLEANAG
jgi:hypothetical protein